MAAGTAYLRFALTHPEHFHVMFGPHGSGPRRVVRRGDAERTAGPRPQNPDGGEVFQTGNRDRPRSVYTLLVDTLTELAAADMIDGPIDAAALTTWSGVHGLATLLVDDAVALEPDDITPAVEHLAHTLRTAEP